MSISGTINETQCTKKLAVVSDFTCKSLDKLKSKSGVDYIDLNVYGEEYVDMVIDQVYQAVHESDIRAILVEDCEILKEEFMLENLRSDIGMPVMNKFDHGTQLACLSSLIGFLRYKNKKIEDCDIVIAKQEDHGDYRIDHEQNAS